MTKIEYNAIDKAVALILIANGRQTVKKEDVDAACLPFEKAGDYKAANAIRAYFKNNLSAVNKEFEMFDVIAVDRPMPARIRRLLSALDDAEKEIAKLTEEKEKAPPTPKK